MDQVKLLGGMMKKIKNQLFYLMSALFACMMFVSNPFLFSQKIDKNILGRIEYREIGPTRQGGRYVDFAWCEKEPHTFYAATATGGLWKTTDNGITFKPLFTNQNVFSIGDIAVSPSNPDIVWIGSGEANNSRSTYWGDGVYKSTNAGKSWENMGLKESHHIGAIEIHPTNPDIVYVAALGHLYSENSERGLYKTEDGGKTWNKVLDVVVKGKNIGVVDCVMDPTNPDIVYAATYDKVRKPYTFNLGGPGSRIYKSVDAGKSWKKLGGGLPEGMLGRIGIDVYKKNPNIVYATIENANKPGMSDEERYQELLEDKSSEGMIGGEVYRSDDGGETWKKVSPEGQSIGGAPAYYYGQIIIDPNNDQVVHVLSAASWGTYDGGKTWKRRPLGFGGDDHALWIDPQDSNHMWLGYDHGMGITYDGGRNWYHPDNIPLAQFYAAGVDMSYPYNVAGGLQDNGSQMGPSTKRDHSPVQFEDWQRMGGGDGMYNVFDWNNNRYLYNESQFGPLQRIDLLTGETKSVAYRNIDKDMRWNWNSPILVSPHNSDVIYHCGNKVVRSSFRGESWEVISPDLTTNNPDKLTTGKGGDGNIQYCTITSLDESSLIEGLLWVGTDDGNVWVTKNRGKDWIQLNPNITGNPGYWVSRVVASHHFPGTAYVSYTGYRRDDFRAFLYKTKDYGKTWTSIASNLPEEPINVIREDHKNSDLLFVGTEFAVYVSIDSGINWTQMKGDMPTQPVHDLVIHPRENDLIVATHGRGIFITDITFLQELSKEVLEKDVHLFNIEPKVKWISNKNINYSSSNFRGESEPRGLVINYYLKNPTEADIKLKIFKGSLLINEIKGTNKAGLNRLIWNMTQRKERTPEEKKLIQERMKMYESYGYNLDIDINYAYEPVSYGEYTFKLCIDKKELTKKSSVLKDHWIK
jgi:photosystem II stability/assembly factor-like uncharacterized protein